jgi:glycosyltransferase involved in cell wall biosynthesis
MKICFVGLDNLPVLSRDFNHHGIGGAQLQMTLLAKALATRGFAVSMVVADYGQPDGAVWDNITTFKAYRFNAGLPVVRFLYPRWTGMWAALRRADADVYFTSCAGMLVGLLALFCGRNGRGLVFRLANDGDADPENVLIRWWRDRKLYEYGLRRADCVLCQNMVQQQGLKKGFDIEGDLIKSLVDPPQRNLSLAERDVSILWVNNLRDLKRPDLALTLACRLPQHHVHMVGGVQPGAAELYEHTKAEAAALSNLTFHGRVPYHDVGDFYDRARVFINTSDTEGFPNSYLQSWRRGVPVVAFFDPDGIIRREGLGVTVGSMDEMVQAVERLLTDDGEWQRASACCRSYMSRMHGDDMVLQPYIEAIELADRKRKLR